MAVSFSLPEAMEQALRKELGDLDQVAKESLAVELYRQGQISIGALARLLGMGVIEADAWLARHGVPLNYSSEDLERDHKALDRLFAERPQ